MGNGGFKIDSFFPRNIMNMITDLRVNQPEIIVKEAQLRHKRGRITKDGKLTILAADHPARMVVRSGDDPTIMGNRQEYLGRVLRVITDPEFDGVMGTTDIVEDLLIVNYLLKQHGGRSFLDEKVTIGCMNRGGLAEASFEMDDRFTSFTAGSIHALRLDGAKMMFRLDLSDPASGWTIDYCSKAITELNRYDIPAFVEPIPVEKAESGYKTLKKADALIKANGVASALGDSSRGIWLKIPFCEGYDKVAISTTCPILMLGGESKGDPKPIFEEFVRGMRAGGNVRGALVGRNVIFPGPHDPMAVAGAVNSIVHKDFTVEQAIGYMKEKTGQNMDLLKRYIK